MLLYTLRRIHKSDMKEWEPNRKYKIKAKIRKVYPGDPNPPLDLKL